MKRIMVIQKWNNQSAAVEDMSESLRNLVAATYYLALFLVLAFIFGGIAGIDLLNVICNGLNGAIILLQQLFPNTSVYLPSAV